MKIELTDKQVDNLLQELPDYQLYTYLAQHRGRTFKLLKYILFNIFNTESYINAVYNILEDVPIQKELFN